MTAKKKNSKRKWIIGGIAIAVAAVIIIFIVLPLVTNPASEQEQTPMLTAVVEKGSIQQTVEGSGSLFAADTTKVQVPDVLQFDEIKVEEGDIVQTGDVLATVDKTALADSVSKTQEQIATIDAQLEAEQNSAEITSVTASVGGRVKQIFAQENSELAAVEDEHDALMVLSLNNKMKAEFKTKETITADQSFAVELKDGTQQKGTVETIDGETVTIVISDEKALPNEQVALLNEAGEQIATGTVSVHTPLNVLGRSGRVDQIKVSLNDKVSTGEDLITLKEPVLSNTYVQLLRERMEHEQLLQTLQFYQKSGVITAAQEGVVKSIPSVDQSSATDDLSDSDATDPDMLGDYSSLLPTSADGDKQQTAISIDTGKTVTIDNSQNALLAAGNGGGNGANTDGNGEELPGEELKQITGELTVALQAPVAGKAQQKSLEETDMYTGTILWQPEAEVFKEGELYAAMVMLRAKDGYLFSDEVTPVVEQAQISNVVVTPLPTNNTLTFLAVFMPSGVGNGTGNGDITGGLTGDWGSLSGLSGAGSMGGFSLGDTSALSGDGSDLVSDGTASSLSGALDQQTLLTLRTKVSGWLTVDIDELDILQVETGQSAKVVLDALDEEEFEAVVDKMSATGSGQSGVTSYPVTLKISNPDERLMEGMNATATIVTDVSEDVLIIPMDALQEEAGEMFVYVVSTQTVADEDDPQMPGEKRIVETGISDGLTVEIISGLEEGEQVIYKDTTSRTEDLFSMFMGGPAPEDGGGMAMQGAAPAMP